MLSKPRSGEPKSGPAQTSRRSRARLSIGSAELRAAAAGEITNAADLGAVRGALARIFERLDLGRLDRPDAAGLPTALSEERRRALHDARTEQIEADGWVIVPWAKPEAVEGFGVAWEPVLTREALSPMSASASCR